MQGTSGVDINYEIITLVEQNAKRARKIAYNSEVKNEVTTGREMNMSKLGKTTAHPHNLTRRGPISTDGNRWGVHPCMLQSRTT